MTPEAERHDEDITTQMPAHKLSPRQETERPLPEKMDNNQETFLWRDRALRLQAEMENYRKRQQRLAETQIEEERRRLFLRFLDVADELERAINVKKADFESMRQGVQITHRTLMQFLKNEKVKPLESLGEPFNPKIHEAVGAAPAPRAEIQPGTVIEVLRPGYMIGERLLRPARVLVSI